MREYFSIGLHVAYWLMIIALLVIAIGGNLSQPPTPPGYAANQTQPNNKDSNEQVKSEGGKTFRQRTTEDPVAFFTLCLVIFTAVLAFSTIGLWLVTGTAARAARDSADALPKLERAYVFIEIDPQSANKIDATISNVIRNDPFGIGSQVTPAIRFQFINHGKTPAVIKEISSEFCHLADLPEDIIYRPDPFMSEIIIASGEIHPRPYNADEHGGIGRMQLDAGFPRLIYFQKEATIREPIISNDAISIKAGRIFLWFYGHVLYEDVFMNSHETRFCWRYDGQNASFQQYDRPGERLNHRT